MNIIDNMPIIIIIAALLINIALGVSNNIGFSALMIRCIIVTIIFGIFGYMITNTVRNALQYNRLSKQTPKKEEAEDIGRNFDGNEDKSVLDIKVLPLGDEEYMGIDNDDDNGFVEVNPVDMSSYNQVKQD